MKREAQFIRTKVLLRDINKTIQGLKELAKESTFAQKSEIMDMIIQAYQSKINLIEAAKKKYPQMNWMQMAFDSKIKTGTIMRNELFCNLINNN